MCKTSLGLTPCPLDCRIVYCFSASYVFDNTGHGEWKRWIKIFVYRLIRHMNERVTEVLASWGFWYWSHYLWLLPLCRQLQGGLLTGRCRSLRRILPSAVLCLRLAQRRETTSPSALSCLDSSFLLSLDHVSLSKILLSFHHLLINPTPFCWSNLVELILNAYCPSFED